MLAFLRPSIAEVCARSSAGVNRISLLALKQQCFLRLDEPILQLLLDAG